MFPVSAWHSTAVGSAAAVVLEMVAAGGMLVTDISCIFWVSGGGVEVPGCFAAIPGTED